jgi:Ca-activated chloride channel family protein
MTSLTWLHAEWWWTVPTALALAALWRLRRRRVFIAFSAVRWVALVRHRSSVVRRLPEGLAAAALVLVLIALMDPALPYSQTEVHSEGLDIVLVLDLSSSMQEVMGLARQAQAVRQRPASSRGPRRPPAKTRLETTKDALRAFIAGRRDDRIGLIVFSDFAYVVSPLTFDRDGLRHYVDMVDDQILRGEGMTAIGDGIGLASYLLARQSTDARRNKVIVVFTDGENNFGRDPQEALYDADAAGMRVHVIGIDIDDEVRQKPAVVGLIQAVRRYGGQYYAADTVSQLRKAHAAIDALEKGRLTSTAYTRNAPVFDWFAAPAMMALLAALSLRAIPYFADFT